MNQVVEDEGGVIPGGVYSICAGFFAFGLATFAIVSCVKPADLNPELNEAIATQQVTIELAKAGHLDGLKYSPEDHVVPTAHYGAFPLPFDLIKERSELAALCPLKLNHGHLDKNNDLDNGVYGLKSDWPSADFKQCLQDKVQSLPLSTVTLANLLSDEVFIEHQNKPELRLVIDTAKQDGDITLSDFFKIRATLYKMDQGRSFGSRDSMIQAL